MTAARAIHDHIGGSQRAVADVVGESKQAWQLYIAGKRSPSEAKLASWADAAGLTITYDGTTWTVIDRSTP
jgi:transcriptional regulator with XRE-family HTH domain